MSVNLKKPSKQEHKVSLRKDEPKNEIVSPTEDVQKRNKQLLFRIGIPVAVLLLITGIVLRNSATGENKEVLNETTEVAENNSMENVAAETDADEITISEKDNSTEEFTEDSRNQEETEDGDEETAISVIGESKRMDDTSIHNYELIVADVTWSEAFEDCISRGGYLCRINSAEENEKIKELLDEQKKEEIYIAYLGGMRDENSEEYHWVDCEKNPYDDIANKEEYISFWYAGEPSYTDYVNDKEIVEKYMAFIYPGATKEWCWNDVNDNVLSLAPDYYSGRISYICEYE